MLTSQQKHRYLILKQLWQKNLIFSFQFPTDATANSRCFTKQAAAAGIKIVFMDQRANGLEAGKDYVSVVSADNYGNGYASGTVLGDA